ncbi:hypothetical protein K438DRAFT_1970641 [Mycena galopus ATCC 62051]|nr:hypothetical protein K438DRAFT_1970641 [Mycena galopus ATCC 62051]
MSTNTSTAITAHSLSPPRRSWTTSRRSSPLSWLWCKRTSAVAPSPSLRSLFPDIEREFIAKVAAHELNAVNLYLLDADVRAESVLPQWCHRARRAQQTMEEIYPTLVLVLLYAYFTILVAHVSVLPSSVSASNARVTPTPIRQTHTVTVSPAVYFNRYLTHLTVLAAQYEGHAVVAHYARFFERQRRRCSTGGTPATPDGGRWIWHYLGPKTVGGGVQSSFSQPRPRGVSAEISNKSSSDSAGAPMLAVSHLPLQAPSTLQLNLTERPYDIAVAVCCIFLKRTYHGRYVCCDVGDGLALGNSEPEQHQAHAGECTLRLATSVPVDFVSVGFAYKDGDDTGLLDIVNAMLWFPPPSLLRTSCSSRLTSVIALLNDELLNARNGTSPIYNIAGFSAKAGWDPVTVLGSPNFVAMRAADGL